MKETVLGSHLRKVPSIAVGCMRLSEKSKDEMNHFIHSALEQGAYFFDHADIYGSGMSETVFGDAFASDPSLHREDVLIQSKCGIRQGCYDLSKEHILESVDGILKRLQTDYLDLLLLHRPDALVEPEEVAAAFDVLFESGKVRHFGVSNHKPMQIALLQKYALYNLGNLVYTGLCLLDLLCLCLGKLCQFLGFLCHFIDSLYKRNNRLESHINCLIAVFDFLNRVHNQLTGIDCRLCTLIRKFSDLGCNYGKALAGFSCTCSLNGCVQGKQVRLLRDLLDLSDDCLNLLGHIADSLHCFGNCIHFLLCLAIRN